MKIHYPLNPSTGIEDPAQLPWTNGNPATGQAGSYPPNELCVNPQTELVGVISAAGITPSDLDMQQVLRAVRSGVLEYYVDTGTASALVITPNPAHTGYTAGLTVCVKLANAIASGATININGLGAKAIVYPDGSSVFKSDFAAGALLSLRYDGTKFQIQFGLGIQIPRSVAGPILYVRTDGNDAHDGSANDSAHAMATISGALAKAANLFNLTGRTLTIQLGNPGTYASFVVSNIPNVSIIGDVANVANYIISGTPQCAVVIGSSVTLRGLTFSSTGTNHFVQATTGGNLNVQNCAFAGSTGGSSVALLCASAGGTIIVGGPISTSVGSGYLAQATSGNIEFASVATTLVGTPAWGGAGIGVLNCGTVVFDGSATFIGAATGKRYDAQLNGVINTGAAGANFIPGNSAGTTATGGQYA